MDFKRKTGLKRDKKNKDDIERALEREGVLKEMRKRWREWIRETREKKVEKKLNKILKKYQGNF